MAGVEALIKTPGANADLSLERRRPQVGIQRLSVEFILHSSVTPSNVSRRVYL